MERISPRWRLFLKSAVTLLAIWLIVRKVDAESLLPVLREASFGWIFVSTAGYLLVLAFNAFRWSVLEPNPGVSYRKHLYYVLVGSFLNLFSPSAALSEGARTYAFGKRYGGVQKNFAAVLFGRVCGILVQLTLALAFAWLFWDQITALPLLADAHPRVAWAVPAGMLAGVLLLVAFRARLRPFFTAFASYVSHPRHVAVTIALSLVIQVLSVFAGYVLYLAVGAEIRLWHIMVLSFIAQVLLLLPISVGGVGVKEYVSLVLFAQFAGLPAERVLAASLLGYVPQFVAAALGGAWMGFRRRSAAEDATLRDG